MNADLRIPMNEDRFDGIPSKSVPRTIRIVDPELTGDDAIDWIFIGYGERLLAKNELLQGHLNRYEDRFGDVDCLKHLTQGQLMFHCLWAFDGEVRNGGITQFFWNCPDLIHTVPHALSALTSSELLANYDRALNSLNSRMKDWIKLRKRWEFDTNWEHFQKSYDLLDLDWFDDPYFELLGVKLRRRLVEYIGTHRQEFIRPLSA